MKKAMLTAAALAVSAAIPTAGHAAQNSKSAYAADLSCAAYNLEIAGFYKSEMGKAKPRSEELVRQYTAAGSIKLTEAMAHAEALGMEQDSVKADLFGLIEKRISNNVTPDKDPAFILAHVKDTTIKAETCQRSDNG